MLNISITDFALTHDIRPHRPHLDSNFNNGANNSQ